MFNTENCMSIKNKNSLIQCIIKKNDPVFYNELDIINCNNVDDLSLDNLKFTAKKLNLLSSTISNNKRELYSIIYNYYEKCINNIIKIQSVFRGYLVRRRNKAINPEEFFNFDNKYDIAEIYYFDYTDKNNYTYCFDIRSLPKIMDKPTPINPYTTKPFESNFINKFNNRISYIKQLGYNL